MQGASSNNLKTLMVQRLELDLQRAWLFSHRFRRYDAILLRAIDL